MHTIRARWVFISAILVFMAVPAFAKSVTLDRILGEHKITVVTTEKPDSISRFLFDMRVRTESSITTTELMIRNGKFSDGQSLLFVIDRKKARRMIAEEDQLLPCQTSAIDPNEVVLFARKALGRNAWDVLISAPNEKWLRWELDRLSKCGLSNYKLEERGTILERFKVKRLSIVSTEGKQVAADWVARQTRPGSDAIDWEFFPADSWDGAADGGTDILFLLSKDALTEKAKGIVSYLPQNSQLWIKDQVNAEENAVEKQVVLDQSGQPRDVFSVISPCSRHLQLTLQKYASSESIPESLERKKLTDLRGYGRMVVIAKTGDTSAVIENKAIDDLAGSLTNAMSHETGFECINRQDLKELAVETYLNYLPDSSQASDLRKKLGGATAVAVIDVSALTMETSYVANSPRCNTPTLAAFSEEKPARPREPRPNDKPLFSAHTYDEVDGSRANDPDFIRDYNNWKYHEMPRYRDALRRWEDAKRDYEDRRRHHDMEWVVTIDKVQKSKFTGNLRIYDLSSAEVDKMGKVVFSCPVAAEGQRSSMHSEDRMVVTGEDVRPQAPVAPASEPQITDGTVISDAFKAACDTAISQLLEEAILPVDKK